MAANLKILFALTLVHFTGDFYTAFINPLFPVFVDKLGLTLTQVGIIAGTMRLMAQTLAPKGRSMVASLVMGFAYGLGGVIAPIIGKLADSYTIGPVLTFMACIPLFILPIIALLPKTRSPG